MHRKLQASSEVDIPTWNFFTILHAWCTLVDSVRTSPCQAPVVPLWKQNTCLLHRLPGKGGAPPSHTSDSTELRMLPADRKKTAQNTVAKRVWPANSKSNKSSSLMAQVLQCEGCPCQWRRCVCRSCTSHLLGRPTVATLDSTAFLDLVFGAAGGACFS